MSRDESLRRAIAIVAALNLAYFVVEFAVALTIGAVSLLADSADFLEDAAVNFLILAALGWSAGRRAKIGMLLSGILLAPGIAFAWTLWEKFNAPAAPAAISVSLDGRWCAGGQLALRDPAGAIPAATPGSLTRAAFLSARNDALANIAIVAAGVVTLRYPSVWPDVIVGFGIAFYESRRSTGDLDGGTRRVSPGRGAALSSDMWSHYWIKLDGPVSYSRHVNFGLVFRMDDRLALYRGQPWAWPMALA